MPLLGTLFLIPPNMKSETTKPKEIPKHKNLAKFISPPTRSYLFPIFISINIPFLRNDFLGISLQAPSGRNLHSLAIIQAKKLRRSVIKAKTILMSSPLLKQTYLLREAEQGQQAEQGQGGIGRSLAVFL